MGTYRIGTWKLSAAPRGHEAGRATWARWPSQGRNQGETDVGGDATKNRIGTWKLSAAPRGHEAGRATWARWPSQGRNQGETDVGGDATSEGLACQADLRGSWGSGRPGSTDQPRRAPQGERWIGDLPVVQKGFVSLLVGLVTC
jgi:hypothetical protein